MTLKGFAVLSGGFRNPKPEPRDPKPFKPPTDPPQTLATLNLELCFATHESSALDVGEVVT